MTEETEQDKPTVPQSIIQGQIDMSDTDEVYYEEENLGRVGMCTECKSVLPDSQVENNVFYQNGMPMACPLCGGVVAIVREAITTDANFHARLDQLRGIGMTGYIPGVTAD